MNKYIITANGTPLDTFDDFNISLNYQIEDILDITKRKTNFSKTIELPGTPNNNLFFQQIFDVNIDNINFNPNLRIPANIRIGDNEILIGNLQLTNIIVDNKDVRYEVVIAGTLKDIINTFGDYYISDLDFSEYNHKRNRTNIINSWTYNIVKNGSTTQSESGDGYVYPYIINGQSDDITNNWYIYDAFPATYVKTVMDKIFEFSNFTYTSDFFESDYFKKLIIPFSEDKLQLPEEETNQRELVVGIDGTQPEATNNIAVTGRRDIYNTIIKYEDPWLYNSSNNWYFPLNRESGTVGNVEFQDELGQYDFIPQFTCQNQGFYDINFEGKLAPKWFSDEGQDIRWKGDGAVEYIYYLYKVNSQGQGTIIDQPIGGSPYPTQYYTPSNTSDNPSPWYDEAANLTFSLNADNVWLEQGDTIRIRVGVRWPSSVKWDIDGVLVNQNQKMNLRWTLAESIGGDPTVLRIKPTSNQSYGQEDINYNQIVPKIKIKDFFLNIVKMFNLVIQDNPNKVNDLIIQPRDEFFQSKQKVLNWSPILDNDSEVKITPMSELDSNTFIYKYKKDSDFFNEEYFDETGTEYGELKVDINNDFSEKSQKLELIFSPTPDAQLYINDRVAPFFCDIDNNQLKPKKVNHRILFYNGLIDCNEFFLKDDEYTTTELTSLTQYPYCGMWDNPTSPTEDLGFGRTDKIYWNSEIYPVNNLFEKYHKNTLESIVDINARLLEAYFYLTPRDISEFDFRDIIFLNGSYWRVNKIENYNPVGSDTLTKVILYKIININIFELDEISIPSSNESCPTDLQEVRINKVETIVYSPTEQITIDCCNSIGGRFINGRCYTRYIGPIGFEDPVRDKYPYTTIGKIPISDKEGPVSLQKNNNSPQQTGSLILGKRNYLSDESGRSLIVGDDNSVVNNVRNTLIVGDGITAREDNSLYIGNVYINEDGEILNSRPSIIDGGLDEVMRLNKTNYIDIIDGGLNDVRPYGGDSKERPIILNGDIGDSVL